jgi:hypothetical protein
MMHQFSDIGLPSERFINSTRAHNQSQLLRLEQR